MRGNFNCQACGLALPDVLLPVRHFCNGKSKRSPSPRKPDPIFPDEFITTERLVSDTLSLCSSISSPRRVVGIARSGLIPASVLATHLGAELWSIDQHSLELRQLGTGTRMQGVEIDGETLLVDDSTWSGNAMMRCRGAVNEAFGERATAVAIYGPARGGPSGVRIVRRMANHLFAWNLPNAPFVSDIGWDLDGVFCRDFRPDEDDDGERYIAQMAAMKPTMHRPRKPIKIVTARLERYRRETETWLRRQRIPVESLSMGPWATKQDRESSDVWAWKAAEATRLGVSMFVESSSEGAARIAAECGIVCLSTDEGRLHFPPQRSQVRRESEFVYRGGKPNCAHFGEDTGIVVRCACPSSEMVPIYRCGIYGTTTTVPVRSENLRRAIEADGRGLAMPATNCRDCKAIIPPSVD